MTEIPPWQQLADKAAEFQELRTQLAGEIHPSAVITGELCLAEGAEIMAGCVIEGKVRIASGSRIGPNAYLRGFCEIGKNCRIGHAVEIKDSIVKEGTFISHLSYIGDSILEKGVNVGGGCILSNYRHDGGEIRMPWQGQLCATGRDKLGAHVGENCRLGCNSVVLPGRVLPANSWLDAGAVYAG